MQGDPFDPLISRGELKPILPERGETGPNSMSPIPSATRDDLRVLAYQFEVLQKRVKEIEARRDFDNHMEMLAARWEEFLSTAEFRFDKIQKAMQKQHELYKAHFRDLQSKIAVANGFMKERQSADQAIYENMEEQRQMIQAFEARMQQWQKIVSEQELQLLNEESDKNRVEKMQAQLQRQYETVQKAFREMQTAVAALSSSQDRSQHEHSVNELVDRQRQMMQLFEVRQQQAHKVVSEQEIQLIHLKNELKETLKELSRLRNR